MAGDWIKMRIDLRDEPEVIGIARRTGLDRDSVVGKLLKVWGWLSRSSRDGSVTNVAHDDLDDIAQRAGFADAMVHVGWLKDTKDGLSFPKFDRHNSASAKARAENTMRQNLSRSSRDKSATREEKRRVPPKAPVESEEETPDVDSIKREMQARREQAKRDREAASGAGTFADRMKG